MSIELWNQWSRVTPCLHHYVHILHVLPRQLSSGIVEQVDNLSWYPQKAVEVLVKTVTNLTKLRHGFHQRFETAVSRSVADISKPVIVIGFDGTSICWNIYTYFYGA